MFWLTLCQQGVYDTNTSSRTKPLRIQVLRKHWICANNRIIHSSEWEASYLTMSSKSPHLVIRTGSYTVFLEVVQAALNKVGQPSKVLTGRNTFHIGNSSHNSAVEPGVKLQLPLRLVFSRCQSFKAYSWEVLCPLVEFDSFWYGADYNFLYCSGTSRADLHRNWLGANWDPMIAVMVVFVTALLVARAAR